MNRHQIFLDSICYTKDLFLDSDKGIREKDKEFNYCKNVLTYVYLIILPHNFNEYNNILFFFVSNHSVG